jgi:SAM-dependent MidA family methyltransferase
MSDRGRRPGERASGQRAGGVPPGIAREIAAEGGRVTFGRFMELALTHPSEGYYSRTDPLLGARGHFSTAPCLSPEFNESVGRLLEELVAAVLPPSDAAPLMVALVELGGGGGDLAKAVLLRLQRERPDLRDRVVYTIVDVGDRPRALQRRALARLIEGGWKVAWAHVLEAGVAERAPRVVIGNEFVDALPVHLVDVRGDQPLEAWVEIGPSGEAGPRAGSGTSPATELQEVWAGLSAEVEAELRATLGTVEASDLRGLSRDGLIEVRPRVGPLLRQLAEGHAECCLVTIDYGDWFAADRANASRAATATDPDSRGDSARSRRDERAAAPLRGRTLRGYFRHQLVTDPYVRVGRQDLTADVDFGALDLHGRRAGFETVLYTTVAEMLRGDAGEERLEALLRRAGTSLAADRRAAILGQLLDGEGLGGAFKVMLQVSE